eukprot:TRINITY_DN2637_c0_g1_i2.p1 TRINITY_DN2637_c0_g1~~TRINITY_DN2637_c0_g1_i2.p1  ORF type:complete len:500 (-),score=89.21 TRINITY_DN2637_c0_g1_i2:48-1547(-)
MDFAHRALAQFGELSQGKNTLDRTAFVEHMEKAWKKTHLVPTVSEDELALDFSAMFDAYDTDGNGEVNFVEFLNGLVLVSDSSLKEKAQFIFNSWDHDKDGYLTINEIREAYGKALEGAWRVLDNKLAKDLGANKWNWNGILFSLTQALISAVAHDKDVIEVHVDALMELLDDNKDGRISLEEWLRHSADIPIFKHLGVDEIHHSGVSIVSRCHCKLGEGPHWDDKRGILFFVDILDQKFFSYNPSTRLTQVHSSTLSYPSCIVPCKENNDEFLLTTQKGLAWFNVKEINSEIWIERTKFEDKAENRFNDGKVDLAGRLWAGTMAIDGKRQDGSLYTIEPDGTFQTRRTNVGISNGLCWSPDQKVMYFIDSPLKKVVAFDYDQATGNITNERDVVVFPQDQEPVPDGMTIDTEGMLWIAIWGGARVVRYDPSSGSELTSIPIPAQNVTSCCWGGAELDVLYVTSARCDTDTKKYPAAGCLFAVRNTGAKGFPMNSFSRK